MPVARCAYCGETTVKRAGRKYCSWECYIRNRAQNAGRTPSHQKKEQWLDSCQYNEGISCFPVGDCTQCGWNPNVARKRLDRILAKLLGAEEVLADGG